jgi:hypothetical protein
MEKISPINKEIYGLIEEKDKKLLYPALALLTTSYCANEWEFYEWNFQIIILLI